MEKENLVLVHSFPTNSFILKGLIAYLDDYFNVYFIDLPGFTTHIAALKTISIDGYSKYIDKRIEELNLDSYVIGGISFGFMIVNNAKLDKKCKGILVIEPYIGSKSLHFGFFYRIFLLMLLDIICLFNLHYIVWNSKWFKRFSERSEQPKHRIHHTLKNVDGRTFFETARLILYHNTSIKFHKLPYVLAINQEDTTVNYNYLIKTFTDNIDRIFIPKVKTDHYPVDITKKYFKKMIPEADINYITNFIFGRN